MIEQVRGILEAGGGLIELFAVAVMIVGFVWALVKYGQAIRATGRAAAFPIFRARLGMAILVGLEILVVADVIETITVEPTFRSLAVLAFLVVVRTIVSWTTALQVEGRWPWQAETEEDTANA